MILTWKLWSLLAKLIFPLTWASSAGVMSEQFLIWLADTAPGHSKRKEVILDSTWWAEKCNRVGKSQLVSLRQLGCSWFSTVVPRSIENPIFGELRKNCWVNCSSILSLHIGLLPNAFNHRIWIMYIIYIWNNIPITLIILKIG